MNAMGMSEFCRGLRNRVFSQIQNRNLSPTSKYDNAILLAAGAPTYLALTQPQLLHGRDPIGLESDVASRIHSEALAEFIRQKAVLKGLAAGDKKFQEKIEEMAFEFLSVYEVYEPSKYDHLIIEEVKKEFPPKYLHAALEWARAGLAEMVAMKERDRAVSQNMISQNGSGILFIGSMHLDSVANMLKDQCVRSNVRSSD